MQGSIRTNVESTVFAMDFSPGGVWSDLPCHQEKGWEIIWKKAWGELRSRFLLSLWPRQLEMLDNAFKHTASYLGNLNGGSLFHHGISIGYSRSIKGILSAAGSICGTSCTMSSLGLSSSNCTCLW